MFGQVCFRKLLLHPVCVCVCVCVCARACVCRSMWRTVAHLASVYHLHEGLDKIVVLAEHLPQPVRKQ